MELSLCFDTTFLIDLQKERGSGPAHAFLGKHKQAGFVCSAVALGEFAEGFSSPADPLLAQYFRMTTILDVNGETAGIYGRITRRLRQAGRLIGSNDLWIASHALQHRLTLVTADLSHFRRVPNLLLLSY